MSAEKFFSPMTIDYPAKAGLAGKPGFLTTEGLLSAFSTDRRVVILAFIHFVAEGEKMKSFFAQT